MAATQGRVIAVCSSPTSGVPKYPREFVVIGPQGVAGDFHAGPVNRHKKSGEPEPNWRQLTLVAQEGLEELHSVLGISLGPGDLGENVLVAGLGDLSQLEKGDQLALGPEVIVEVTSQNRPCSTLRSYHPDIVEALTGKRGVTAVVVTTGTVRVDDPCRVLAGARERSSNGPT